MRHLSYILVFASALVAVPANAATLFSDNFDSLGRSSSINAKGLEGWHTMGGSVDYVRQANPWAVSCAGGSNGCIDLDGSTRNGGRFQRGEGSISFHAGQTYELSAWISGNQRGGAADNLLFGISSIQADLMTQTISNLDSNSGFQKYSLLFTAAFDFRGSIFFEDMGGDNVGALLDDVTLSTVDTLFAASDTPREGSGSGVTPPTAPTLAALLPGRTNDVPLPGSLLLMVAGATAALAARRR